MRESNDGTDAGGEVDGGSAEAVVAAEVVWPERGRGAVDGGASVPHLADLRTLACAEGESAEDCHHGGGGLRRDVGVFHAEARRRNQRCAVELLGGRDVVLVDCQPGAVLESGERLRAYHLRPVSRVDSPRDPTACHLHILCATNKPKPIPCSVTKP